MKHLGLIALVCVVLAGCASAKVGYQPPSTSVRPGFSREVSRPKDLVWNDAVAALGQRFFVINNMDKASGLINVSYSGDPARFIDCGRATVEVSGLNAKTQTFDGAAAEAAFESVGPVLPYGMPGRIFVRRQMTLEGRVNVIFETVTPESTRVTTATRYVVTRRFTQSNAAVPYSDTVGFNGNERGRFPQHGDSAPLECVVTGELENSILSVIK
jgi:hypothetical protein